jgi:hypothetical protein
MRGDGGNCQTRSFIIYSSFGESNESDIMKKDKDVARIVLVGKLVRDD